MTVLHIFTEEPSAKILFDTILPSVLSNQNVTYRIYPHQGKQDLERALKTTLPHISKIPYSKILITRDQDSSGCIELKQKLESLIKNTCQCEYRIRIVCKELEAWFLGDLKAIQLAFPRFKPEQYQSKADFKNVDAIINPNHYLLKIIPEYKGKSNLPKLETAERISPFLDLEHNQSSSFNHTLNAIKELLSIL